MRQRERQTESFPVKYNGVSERPSSSNHKSKSYLPLMPHEHSQGGGIAQWLERRARDRKGRGFEFRQERRENFRLRSQFFVLTLTSVSVSLPHTARKRSRSFCQKRMWQVTHAPCVCGFAGSDVTWCTAGCVVYTKRAEMAAVSCGASHVTTKQHCKYSTSVEIVKNALYKTGCHSLGITSVKSAVSLLESRE